jgi:glucokinase
LRLNPDANYVIGIDVDVTETAAGAVNLNGDIKLSETLVTHPELGPEVLTDELCRYTERLIAEQGLDKSKVIGVGIAVPGKVEPETGILVYSANLNWRNVNLKQMISEKIGIDTIVEGDAQSMALGEHFFGNGKGVNSLVWVNVSGGVGVGLIDKGTINRGEHRNAGEVGHITVLRDGPPCSCGRRGCLETMVGSSAVLSRLIKTIAKGKETLVSDIVHGRFEDLRIWHLFHAAKEGDNFAGVIVEEMAYYLGIGLSMIINLIDPGLIVIGGPVIDSGGDKFFEMVKRFASEDILAERVETLDIRRSALGEHAGVIGAASLIYQDKFKIPLMK